MPSVTDYERSMIDYLAVSDPNMNTGLGTPVRKIITAVAAELAELNVDMNTSTTLYAIDAVSGAELDYLVGQFGFTRQDAKSARGTITVKRDNGDGILSIPYGTVVKKQATTSAPSVSFETTAFQELGEGVLSADISVVAMVPGASGNVASDTIHYSTFTSGFVTITNDEPTYGGRDAETDADLRQRFLTTVFRNESGTKDQYTGLALAHQDIEKVNIIGQDSRYSEVTQIEYDTSSASYIATVSNDQVLMNVGSIIDSDRRFWVRDTESDVLFGRGTYTATIDWEPAVGGHIVSVSFTGEPISKSYVVSSDKTVDIVGSDDGFVPGSVLSVSVVMDGSRTVLTPTTDYHIDTNNPGIVVITATQITVGTETVALNAPFTVDVEYRSLHMAVGEYVTIEFDYVSKFNRGELKSVDMFIDGEGREMVTDVQFLDLSKVIAAGAELVRKNGKRPDAGNVYIPLAYTPMMESTGSINVGTSTILKEAVYNGDTLVSGQFNMLYDTSNRFGSAYAADAVELIVSSTRDNIITLNGGIDLVDGTPMSIPYYYNDITSAVQSLIDAQSVITMDTLVHHAKVRMIQVNLAVMFSSRQKGAVRSEIEDAVVRWANNLPFGYTVQFSDIETVVANLAGVDNVRVAVEDVDSSLHYGIVEYERDGKTEKTIHTNDFGAAQNELVRVAGVNIINKSQQSW